MSETQERSDICVTTLLVKRAAAADLRVCRLSREQVADRLSVALCRRITLAQIDAVVSETKEHRFPAEWIPAWVQITGSARLLEMLCREAGYWLADEGEHGLAEYGRTLLQREKLDERADVLRGQLWSRV